MEFKGFDEITARFGPLGIQRIAEPGYFTDDTQMTLFTAEGMIRWSMRSRLRGIGGDVPRVLYHAYLRWLFTQGYQWPPKGDIVNGPITSDSPDGWLVHDRRLHHRMAPGNTCIGALESGVMGTLRRRINNSKGCGAVMRIAPVGVGTWHLAPNETYEIACEVAAITHGHDDGIHPAGALAVMIAALVRGDELDKAVQAAIELVPEVLGTKLAEAIATAKRKLAPDEMNQRFGLGFTGDEALAIALYCAFAYPDFASAIRSSVNHDGDLDSTGSICGNILGAELREGDDELGEVFAVDLVETVAADLALEMTQFPEEASVGYESHLLVTTTRLADRVGGGGEGNAAHADEDTPRD